MPDDTETEDTTRGASAMHKETGAVATFETKADADAAGYTVPLSKDQHDMALHMNRKQRRAWAAAHRSAKKPKAATP
jgi:hypothetical protein